MQAKKLRALLSLVVLGAVATTLPLLAQGPAITSATPAGPTVVLESVDFRATLAAQSTGVTRLELKDPRYEHAGKPINLVTTDKDTYLPLHISAKGMALGREQPWRVLESNAREARFRTRASGLTFTRKVEVGSGPFQLWSTLRVDNPGAQKRKLELTFEGHHYVRRADEKGGILAGRSALTAGVLCLPEGTPERVDREKAVEKRPTFTGKTAFGAVDTVYFTQAIAADKTPFSGCRVVGSDRGGSADEPDGALLSVLLDYPALEIPAGGSVTVRTLNYLGPKLPKLLAKAGHELPRANFVGGLPGIDSIAKGLVAMLSYIHTHTGNWGVAIILLTLLVKLVLFPLTSKSYESMGAMRKLKPEIDRINERFADDREKKGAAMMELYKNHKINPLGGCLPQLFQLPIWWALYMSLSSNVELFKRPFFGFWQDLAAPDPYYALPLLLGLLMWVQQKITPSTMDPAQAKMMLYMMPIMITAFMLFLPAGLCLYMLTNSVLSIAQQRFIEYRSAEKKMT